MVIHCILKSETNVLQENELVCSHKLLKGNAISEEKTNSLVPKGKRQRTWVNC